MFILGNKVRQELDHQSRIKPLDVDPKKALNSKEILFVTTVSILIISVSPTPLFLYRYVRGCSQSLLFFAYFTTQACDFVTFVFSDCLTIGYASFDAKNI